MLYLSQIPRVLVEKKSIYLGTDHLISGGGGWIFFEKTIVCFPIGQKNVFNEVKNKKVCSPFSEFLKPFSLGAIQVCK